jgi:processive 1,2-diacylglycerol beta-glucosyltransferase
VIINLNPEGAPNRKTFDRVLIVSASVGGGHIRAAQALERAFSDLGAAREVRHIDSLDFTNKVFRNIYAKSYFDLISASPDLIAWLYDRLDTPWRHDRLRLALSKLNTRPLVRLLERYQPDVLVCTHFLPAEIISWLKASERIACRQAIVVTDFDAHAMWLCRHYERYFVALDETRAYLAALGVAADRISVTGIPIDPVFGTHKDKHEMRRKHGLAADKLTILVSAGGFGVGPIKTLISALRQLRHPSQILAICGRNEALRQELEKLNVGAPANGSVSVKVIGFTTEIDEYMAASELVVGKPGGLTSSEALARGLVFVVVNPIPGQEERNADHLLEEGAALRCNNLPVLAYKIDQLIDDPGRLFAMQCAAQRMARPRAAYDIVSKLLESGQSWSGSEA